jgi:hypothetical protein
MPHFIVYEQSTPQYAYKDKNGDDVYTANLVELAVITCAHKDRFDAARIKTRKPVLKEFDNANH